MSATYVLTEDGDLNTDMNGVIFLYAGSDFEQMFSALEKNTTVPFISLRKFIDGQLIFEFTLRWRKEVVSIVRQATPYENTYSDFVVTFKDLKQTVRKLLDKGKL